MKRFVNLPVRAKLLSGFGMVVVFSIILSVAATLSVHQLDQSYSHLINSPLENVEHLRTVHKLCSDMRMATVALMLNTDDSALIDNYWGQYERAYNDAVTSINRYITNNDSDTMQDSTARQQNNQIIRGALKTLESYMTNTRNAVASLRSKADFDTSNAIFLAGAPMVMEVSDTLISLIDKADAYVAEESEHNTAQTTRSIVQFSILSVIIVVLSVLVALYISSLITVPLVHMADFLNTAGTTGDLSIDEEEQRYIETLATRHDEIAQMSQSLSSFTARVLEVTAALESLARGDLDVDFDLLSQRDTLGLSLKKTIDDLSGILAEMRTASVQVSAGAAQISHSSQSLASGSSQQAGSIDEFSVSISEMLTQTQQNAEHSRMAHAANSETSARLQAGIESMVEMTAAMKAIDESSRSITQIIKVIDDIAFQTNILALNAAVEAARAGVHGKGFAVVADEVRNLAAKSAQAAKETAALIESSSQRVQAGNKLAERANSDMQSATENARESTRIIELVAAASLAQVDAISEISSNIEQISSVIQANSALSQESAASAQEMSAQSMVLSRIVDSFRLKNMSRTPALSFNYPPPAIPEPPTAGIEGPYSYNSLGKY